MDLRCGTDHSLDFPRPAVGLWRTELGADRARGMLRLARRRVRRAGWKGGVLYRVDATASGADDQVLQLGGSGVDAVFCTLGLTAPSHWKRTLEAVFSLMRPGGRITVGSEAIDAGSGSVRHRVYVGQVRSL